MKAARKSTQGPRRNISPSKELQTRTIPTPVQTPPWTSQEMRPPALPVVESQARLIPASSAKEGRSINNVESPAILSNSAIEGNMSPGQLEVGTAAREPHQTKSRKHKQAEPRTQLENTPEVLIILENN